MFCFSSKVIDCIPATNVVKTGFLVQRFLKEVMTRLKDAEGLTEDNSDKVRIWIKGAILGDSSNTICCWGSEYHQGNYVNTLGLYLRI